MKIYMSPNIKNKKLSRLVLKKLRIVFFFQNTLTFGNLRVLNIYEH